MEATIEPTIKEKNTNKINLKINKKGIKRNNNTISKDHVGKRINRSENINKEKLKDRIQNKFNQKDTIKKKIER